MKMMGAAKKRFFLFLLLWIIFGLGCASKGTKNTSPEKIDLQKAKDFQQAGRYELAIENYSTVKNKYPLSPEAVEAELELAETYYLQGSYVESRVAFEAFIDLHPLHEKIDFAAYRVAMSHYKQIPSTTDRDMTSAAAAIKEIDHFLESYPKSQYATELLQKREECGKKLAEKEIYIARFYFKKEAYRAAAGRYRVVLKKHRKLGFDEEALYKLALCYYELHLKKKAKRVANVFLKHYPHSTYTSDVKSLLSKP